MLVMVGKCVCVGDGGEVCVLGMVGKCVCVGDCGEVCVLVMVGKCVCVGDGGEVCVGDGEPYGIYVYVYIQKGKKNLVVLIKVALCSF